MGPAMLLPHEAEIAYRRETVLADFARIRRAPRAQGRVSEGVPRRMARVRLALRQART